MAAKTSLVSYLVPPPSDSSKARIGFLADAAIEFEKLSTKERAGLLSKLKELAFNPHLGKPLLGQLQGSVRLSYGRLRCVARCADGVAVVLVLVVAKRAQGNRDDVYEKAYKRLEKRDNEIKRAIDDLIRAYYAQQNPRSGL